MRTLQEAQQDKGRELAAAIETDAKKPLEVFDAINDEMGEEFLPLNEIEDAIRTGMIEICTDGVVVWMPK